MRLFLSSYRAGKYEKRFREIIGDVRKVLIITNAKDDKSGLERQESVQEVFDFFKKLNIQPYELDLRPFFQKKEGLEDKLEQYKFIWIAGGNTFVLRRALNYSGGDKLLIDLIKADKVIYGGESAGAIIATPSLTGVEFGDDPNDVPKGYEKKIIKGGLELVPFHIVPHYRSAWFGAYDMAKALKKNNLSYKTLTDDQAIIVDGDKVEILKWES